MEYCGIDLHQNETEICVIDDDGTVIERARIKTSRTSFKRRFDGQTPMKVVLEAGGSSPWVSRLIASMGHDVVVCAPRRVRLIAESTMKTDEIDAEVLARLVRVDQGFLGRVTHRSESAQLQRGLMTARTALVNARSKWVHSTRGLLRSFGFRVPGGSTGLFHARCAKVEMPDDLRAVVQPLLNQIERVSEEIQALEERLEATASTNPVVHHLQSVPGVGTIVSMYYVASIDDPDRFPRSRDVAAFFGLRPSFRGSADVCHYGKITKEGDPEMRRLLIQAAHGMINSRKPCALQQWALNLAARRGKKKALVALARKIAVLLHHLWATGEVFQPFPNQQTN
ncbi:MAG: IS110 family transposase [Candidatus Sulfomarinibacteraceae bacterium]